MCDKKNCKGIVGELLTFLNYLNVNIPNDFAIREELVLKIAILAEKFASQYKWYVDVMLKVINVAGDVMTNDIWFRVVKTVTNHQDVQQYATETAFVALQEDTVNETMIKLASFLCGEFGKTIATTPESGSQGKHTKAYTGAEQCRVLTSKFSIVSEPTKAIILSALLKLAAHFPEVSVGVAKVYAAFSTQFNPELQQRAIEYGTVLKLHFNQRNSGSGDDSFAQLLAKITETLPAYNEVGDQEEVLEVHRSRIGRSTSTTSPNPNSSSPPAQSVSPSSVDSDGSRTPSPDAAAAAAAAAAPGSGKKPKGEKKKKKHHKAVLGEGTETVNAEFTAAVDAALGNAPSTSASGEKFTPQTAPAATSAAPQLALAPPPAAAASNLTPAQALEANFKKLCLTGQGVLFEDDTLQVGLKSDYAKGQGRVYIYFGNKSSAPLTNFVATIPPTTYIAIQLTEPLPNVVEPGSQQRIGLALQCLAPFGVSSLLQLSLSFLSNGKSQHHKWDLPITISRFCEGASIDAQKFFGSWQQTNQPSQISVDVVHSLHPINVSAISKVIQLGLRLNVLDGVDKNSNNITAAGVFICAQGQSFVLTRIETNAEAQMMRITLKTSNPSVTAALKGAFASALGKDASS